MRKCKKVVDNIFFYHFQKGNQTLKNIFMNIFNNATKLLKIIYFPKIIFT